MPPPGITEDIVLKLGSPRQQLGPEAHLVATIAGLAVPPSRPGPPRRPGRPRDTNISGRALIATRELLIERGFDATTIQPVAERSGVHASAIYRRWPSRIELIEEAAFPGISPADVHPTGDLGRDLHRFIRAYMAAFDAPAARAAAGPQRPICSRDSG